jgi:uncharacterized protein YceK
MPFKNPHLLICCAILMVGLILSGCSSEEQTYPTPSINPTYQGDLQDTVSLDKQEDHWREVVEQTPDDPNANYRLGLVLAISNPEEALTFFEAASQLSSAYRRTLR